MSSYAPVSSVGLPWAERAFASSTSPQRGGQNRGLHPHTNLAPISATTERSLYTRHERGVSGSSAGGSNSSGVPSPHSHESSNSATPWTTPTSGSGGQVSKSYFKPRTLQMYSQALSTVKQRGFLELNVEENGGHGRGASLQPDLQRTKIWTQYWFDLSREALMWFNSEEDARQFIEFDDDVVVGRIQLDRIVRVRVTSEREDSLSVAVQQNRYSPPAVYNLRAKDKSTRNLWLHSFHSCVAWLITTITRRQLRAKSSSQGNAGIDRLGGRHRSHEVSGTLSARTENAFDRFNYPEGHRATGAHQPIDINRASASPLDDDVMAMPTVLKERGSNALSYGSFQDVPQEGALAARGGGSPGSGSEDDPIYRRHMFQRQLTVASGSGRHDEEAASHDNRALNPPLSRQDFAGLDDEEELFGMELENESHGLSMSMNDDDDEGVFAMTGNFDESGEGLQTPAPAQATTAASTTGRFSTRPSAGKYIPPRLRAKLQEAHAAAAAAAAPTPAPAPAPAAARQQAPAPAAAAAAAATAKAKAENTEAAQQLSGICAIQGSRSKMEDRDLAIDNFDTVWPQGPRVNGANEAPASVLSDLSRRHSLYAVFDGHDGVQAAQFAVERISGYISEDPNFSERPVDAFVAAIKRIDTEFLQLAAESNGTIYCGSTVLTAYVRSNKVYVCTVGDSRCMLCRAGVAKELSKVLTPGTPSERARIEAAGGWITEDQELVLARLHHMKLEDPLAQQKLQKKNYLSITTHRVNGTLSVSRALGDPEYKGDVGSPIWMYPKEHSKQFTADLVISDPCVVVEDLEESKDEFLILACDGLWDVMDGQDAVDIVKHQFLCGATAKAAAEFVVKKALELGTSDNVSVIVAPLMPVARFSKDTRTARTART